MASLTSDIQRALQLAVGEANSPFVQSQSHRTPRKKRTCNNSADDADPSNYDKKKKKKVKKPDSAPATQTTKGDDENAHPPPTDIDQQDISVDGQHTTSTAFLNAVVAAASATSEQPLEIAPYQPATPFQDQQILPDHPSPYIQYPPAHYGFHDPSQFDHPSPQGHPMFPTLPALLPDFHFASNDDIIHALQDMDVSKIATVLKSLGDAAAAAANAPLSGPPPPFVPPHIPANAIPRSQPQQGLPSTSTAPVLSSVPKSTKSSHKRVLDMSLPGPEQTNLEHAHLLANKWMNASKLAELVKSQGRRVVINNTPRSPTFVQVSSIKKANFPR